MKRLRTACWLVCLALPGLCPAPALAQDDRTPTAEYKLKAALLYKLAQFVEWPDDSVRQVFHICVLGRDPFGAALDALTHRDLSGKPIEVRRLQETDTPRDQCNILFVADAVGKTRSVPLRELAGRAVLTVGDTEGFAEQGGMIQMSLKQKRVGFIINLYEARQAGLRIAAQLLELSTVIQAPVAPDLR